MLLQTYFRNEFILIYKKKWAVRLIKKYRKTVSYCRTSQKCPLLRALSPIGCLFLINVFILAICTEWPITQTLFTRTEKLPKKIMLLWQRNCIPNRWIKSTNSNNSMISAWKESKKQIWFLTGPSKIISTGTWSTKYHAKQAIPNNWLTSD